MGPARTVRAHFHPLFDVLFRLNRREMSLNSFQMVIYRLMRWGPRWVRPPWGSGAGGPGGCPQGFRQGFREGFRQEHVLLGGRTERYVRGSRPLEEIGAASGGVRDCVSE